MSISCSIIEFLIISILFLADCVFRRQIHSSLDLLSFLLTVGKRFVLVSIFIKLSQFTPLPCTALWVGLGVVVTVRIFRTFDFPPDTPLCVLGIEQMLFCLTVEDFKKVRSLYNSFQDTDYQLIKKDICRTFI